MTNADILDWFFILGRNTDERMFNVRELLRHATADRMSDADRVICRRVLHGDLTDAARAVPARQAYKLERRKPANIQRRDQRREAAYSGYIAYIH